MRIRLRRFTMPRVLSAVDHWQEINSEDGIVDSRSETFTVKTGDLAPGEHVITLRAYDMAGNVGIGKAVVEIPARQ